MSKFTSGDAIAIRATNAAVTISPGDDTIPLVTGITLIDAEPELIARRMRHRSWSDRTRYLNNIVAHSIERQARMLDYARSVDDAVAFLTWSQTEIMRRIGEVLDLWGETEPADADAAVLFCLSLNPLHRRAAQSWTKGDQQFFDTVQENWLALAAFFNLCAMSDICAASAWRAGPRPCSDTWFNLPGWVA